MTVVYLVQHGEKEPVAGDPGLTSRGQDQAARTGEWLRDFGLNAVYSSPLLRAGETAQLVAAASGLVVQRDVRLRERAGWNDGQPFDDFAAEWARSLVDRDYAPPGGDSSHAAGQRLRAFLLDVSAEPGPVAAVTHGGITADLLRTLLGDAAVPRALVYEGVPPCAITTIHNLEVIELISEVHLSEVQR